MKPLNQTHSRPENLSTPAGLHLEPSSSPSSIHGDLTLISSKHALSTESHSQTIPGYTSAANKSFHNPHDVLSSSNEENRGGGPPSLPFASAQRPINRSPSPVELIFVQAAATMLSSSEETAGTRTLMLARGPAASPTPPKSSRMSLSRHTSENSRNILSRRMSDRQSTDASNILGSIGITELLQVEDRPSFVLDLSDRQTSDTTGLDPIYINPALGCQASLFDHVHGRSDDPTVMFDFSTPFREFRLWAVNKAANFDEPGSDLQSIHYAGYLWKRHVLRKRFCVVSGLAASTPGPDSADLQRPALQSFTGLSSSSLAIPQLSKTDGQSYFDSRPIDKRAQTPGALESLVIDSFPPDESPMSQGEESTLANRDLGIRDMLAGPSSPLSERRNFPARNLAESFEVSTIGLSDKGFFDWTRLPHSPSLPAHIQFARSIDWGATSLGPLDTWSPDLRGMCNLIMASPHPAAMYWGPDHVAIYNEAYIQLAGKRHPTLMGQRYADAWVEIWDVIEEVFANAVSNAQATMKDDDCLFLMRNGYLEETYFSWSIIPLIGADGSVVGLYNPAFEKTRRKIAERRMLTLREVGEKTATAREVTEFWSLLIEGLAYNEYDAPLVMVYSLQDDQTEKSSETASSATSSNAGLGKQCYLEGLLGIQRDHPAAPTQIDIRNSDRGFATAFRQAMQTRKPVVLTEEDGTLDKRLLDNIEWRGYNDRSRTVVLSPIQPTTGDSTLGFLVMGTNPRRPYDEDYDLFVQLLGRQLATSVASVVLFEEEIRKGEKAAKLAAQDRIELSNQLAARTQEAEESDQKFTRMAELAPVGMFMADSRGLVNFSNGTWHDISSYPRNAPVADNWIRYVHEDDQGETAKKWSEMLLRKVPFSTEIRFKTPRRDKNGNTGPTWVIASAYPELDQDGNLKRIFGSVTDISSQKSAEDLQKRRMEEAVEMKRQQENFIDTTSHEMRNPLSAILQCADEISVSLTELHKTGSLDRSQRETVESNIDAAQTITLCASHQKRIVDDVLTMSKLDSAMLLVTPVDVQPVTVVQRALKMFEGELLTADIELDFRVDNSFHALNVDWVRLDPSRLLQVLINLTTNAIKFTTTQGRRQIIMHLGASTERPSEENKYNVTYITSRVAKDRDPTSAPEWGNGECLFIHFAVQDTGRGLNEDEKKVLFQRFSQASPRTHVTYGGSGLGLFISRELVELQGGEIGVSSEAGKGSTFGFYIKARRSKAPAYGASEELGDLALSRKSSASSQSMKIPHSRTQNRPLSGGYGSNTYLSRVPSHSPTPPSTPVNAEHLKILIVEDNIVNQRVLAKQLRKVGCTVYVANHGGEAIDVIRTSTYHNSSPKGIDISVVLMDLEMPVMDGQTCARKLREMQLSGELVRHIPVIAVTANAREQQIKDTLDSGMDDVVSKPFRVSELLNKVEALISRLKKGKH